MAQNNEVIVEKPFQNSGVTRRLAVMNWRSSSIHPASWQLQFVLYNYCIWQTGLRIGLL